MNGLSRIGLVVLLAGQRLPMIDFSIVNVAPESITRSLSASPAKLELIVSVYGVACADAVNAVVCGLSGRLRSGVHRQQLLSPLFIECAGSRCWVGRRAVVHVAADGDGNGTYRIGSVLVHLLHSTEVRYDIALIDLLGVEWSVMLLLMVGACWMHCRSTRSETNQGKRTFQVVGK
ncbi:hypothetical protein [Lonsdalea populi]|uniref:Uncharacterized protein n=2 Tax=Lonsdalea TaxID=1082702 RepID=A0ACD1JFV8_9GAMM|nr:hypothetical protein AU508_00805 [Lonsdalea populi]RAT16154.1 hypothetical protein AU485_01700 [Lonsdalea quercina]OSN02678.1 hypothetical protein AU499_00810 [Lonsdalea populi]RAT22189.1 hypothetical protein AU487_04000 [Lonsdalea populi]RAT25404.1 hypothetical protein AU489_06800 [Lonsdalea populi]